VGINVYDVSIKNARKKSRKKRVSAGFFVRDAENTGFSENSFDIIFEQGSLHHLNLDNAYREIARILKPDGRVYCVEALKYNPVISFYRKITPDLRSRGEIKNIFGKKQIKRAEKYFGKVRILRFYYLLSVFAVFFRNSFLFSYVLSFLEKIDYFLFKIPFIKWYAWIVVFELRFPK
jgi:ubiquinone/menaquinone biosynthesis C-methylase UbiE